MKSYLFDEISLYTPKIKRNSFKKLERSKSNLSIFTKTGDFTWNMVLFIILLLCAYTVFVGRLVVVQISSRDNYINLADKNRIREFNILPGRGVIYDRNNQVIVRNKPSFSLELNTLICSDAGIEGGCAKTLENIQEYLNLDAIERIKSELNGKHTNILLATGLKKEDILSLEANINKLPGVSIETAPSRDYLYDLSISHLVGYVGLGSINPAKIEGKTGIEEYYDRELSGVLGTKIVQVDSNGTQYKILTYKDSLPGKDIRIFLDIKLQQLAYNLLDEEVKRKDSSTKAGAIVASDPATGGILALVSYPSFDPNKMSSGISILDLENLNSDPNFPFFNRTISGVYPPGSTFKMVTASAALMEGITNEYLTIFDSGFLQIGSFIFRNWKLDGHGEVNFLRALQVSNDTYFYTMGGGYGGVKGLGITKMHSWAQKLGYGSKLGIDISGEQDGYMPDGNARDWYLGDNYITAIGQGDILATPLQVNNMTSYFASGGYLYKPRIVKSIDGVGDTKKEILQQDLVDEKSFELITKGLNLAVKPGGTAYPLFDFPQKHGGIELAGKTGTAEYINSDGEDSTHAWFTVFGPYYPTADEQKNAGNMSAKPIVITVFLEGGGSGSDDASPIARKMLDYWFEEFEK